MESKNSPKPPVKKRRKRTSKENKPYYVNPKEFLELIRQYYDDDTDKKLESQLGEAIYKIATGLSFAPNFINYSYKDDMVGDAIVKMYSALKNKKYNIESGNNPFSYFTTIAFHAFINRIKKEKKHRDMINEYQESIFEQLSEVLPNGGASTDNNLDDQYDSE